MTRLSEFTQIPQAYGNQIAINAAVKQILETYQGNVGNKYGLDRVVRFRDLVSLDPIKFNTVMRTSATSRITRITGNILRTGKIESNDSATYFDLDNDKLVFNAKIGYTSSMPGIFMGNDGGTYKVNIGYDATNFFKFSGTKILIKAANFELDASGNIIATSATLSGTITATAGAIGGWIITANGIADNATENDAKIFLDKANTKIRVGPSTGYVDIDGENVRVRSSNYASGAMGSGFSLSSGLLEVGNIACRGMFRTSVFQKDVVSVVGGNLLVLPGDVLDTDMTALDSSTLKIEGNETFAVGDILRQKSATDDEWFEVTNIASAPIYTVTRDKSGNYAADSNPVWKKGQAVVNYRQSGDGAIYMTASESYAPYISVVTQAGSPWSALTTRLRMGNLNGYLGYASNKYGIAIGETNKYLKYDPTNGLRIKGTITITGGSGIASLSDAGALAIEDTADFATLVSGAEKPSDNATVNATFYQAGIPTSLAIGDLWVDSDDNNKLYRAASVGANEIIAGEWVLARDDGIAQAIADAATACADATTAIADAATAQGELDDISADTKITPVEKLTLKPLWNAVVAEKTDIDTQADTYLVSKTAYGTAYTNLNNYLNTTLTVFSNMSATTNITRSTWDGYWEAYFNAKIEILNAIATATASLADWASITGANKPSDNADVTSANTANDTSNVGNVPASSVSGWACGAGLTYIDGGKILSNTINLVGGTHKTAASGRRVQIDSEGIKFITGSVAGKYGTNFKYGDGTKYGSGILADFYNTSTGMPFYVNAEQTIADMHLYNRGATPTGIAEIGDKCVVGGKDMTCDTAGTPGNWVVTGDQTA